MVEIKKTTPPAKYYVPHLRQYKNNLTEYTHYTSQQDALANRRPNEGAAIVYPIVSDTNNPRGWSYSHKDEFYILIPVDVTAI